MERKTKIVCTIGPASESREMLGRLMENGMNVCRLNFSHGDYEEHGKRVTNIREVAAEKGVNIAIALDTKGPEVRLGAFANDKEEYQANEIVRIVREEMLGTHECFHIQVPEVFEDVEVGGMIRIDDGKMKLTIIEKKEGELVCRVENPGALKSKKGCNLPGVKLSMPFLSEKDINDIRFGCRNGIDYLFASFTRRKEDIFAIREILKEEGREDVQVVPKIENQEGFDNIEEILEVSDGVMVARGDFGVNVDFELVPIYQKSIIKTANAMGKPVITATHMLESMQANPRCTRAEASDVANAVLDGTDCIMLSGESAAGDYPIESVQTMNKIAKASEDILPYKERLNASVKTSQKTINDTIAIAVADASLNLDIAAIVAFTQSGTTARRISKFRPKCPILAVTFDEKHQRTLAANWGVTAIVSDIENNQTNEFKLACTVAKGFGIQPGETIIIVAGYPSGVGATNSMKIVSVK